MGTFVRFLIVFLVRLYSYWKNKLSTANAASNNLVLFFSLFDSARDGKMAPDEFVRMMRYCLSLRYVQ
jgi:hypothetical protein